MSKATNHTIKHDVPDFQSTTDLHNHITQVVSRYWGKREAAYLIEMWNKGMSYRQMVEKFPWLKSRQNIQQNIISGGKSVK